MLFFTLAKFTKHIENPHHDLSKTIVKLLWKVVYVVIIVLAKLQSNY